MKDWTPGISQKTYRRIGIGVFVILLAVFGLITIVVDPLFHFHKPLKNLQYPLYDERYMNDGIVRHFDYNAVITGTSMTENFLASQFDSLYGTKSVKVPISGATYREINDLLKRAFSAHPDDGSKGQPIRYVLRSLDEAYLITDKDAMNYEDYPDYLYDDNPLNDVKYFWNEDIFTTFTQYVFTYNRLGGISTNFDTYKNWHGLYPCDAVKNREDHIWARNEAGAAGKQFEQVPLTEEERTMVRDNLKQNIIQIAVDHPNTEFLVFVPPYSICWWDDERMNGKMEKDLEAMEIVTEMLTEYDNIHLYAFSDYTDITTNLGLYIDSSHYEQDVSNLLIQCMNAQVGLITQENRHAYMDSIRSIYTNFDYDAFFAEDAS